MTAIKTSIGGVGTLLHMNQDRLIALGVVLTALAVGAEIIAR